jgi:hypothetical protein
LLSPAAASRLRGIEVNSMPVPGSNGADTSALDRLVDLRQQAGQVRGYLARAEEARDRVREAVYRRVVGEYTERLARLDEQVASGEAEARDAYARLLARREEVAAPCEEARIAIEEIELRCLVGEIDERERDARRQAPAGIVERASEELAALDPVLARFREVLEAPAPAAPAAEPIPAGPGTSAGRSASQAVEPAPASAPMPAAPVAAPPEPGAATRPSSGRGAEPRKVASATGRATAAAAPALASLETTREAPAYTGDVRPTAPQPGARPKAAAAPPERDRGAAATAGPRPSPPGTVEATRMFNPEGLAGSAATDPLLLGVPLEPPTLVGIAPRAAVKKPALPAGFLTLTAGPGAGEYRLERSTTIGRGDDCAIHVADATVSRHHAVVTAGEDGFRIRDLQSQNGTLVNGEPAADRPLADNDQILVGDVLLVFRTAPAAAG